MNFTRIQVLALFAAAVCFLGCNENANVVATPSVGPNVSAADKPEAVDSEAKIEKSAEPELKLEVGQYTKKNGTHNWTVSGDSIASFEARLHLISEGEVTVVDEFKLKSDEAVKIAATINVSLKVNKNISGTPTAMLQASSQQLQAHGSKIHQLVDLPKKLGRRGFESATQKISCSHNETIDGRKLRSPALTLEEAIIYYRRSPFPLGSHSYSESIDGMTQTSKNGIPFLVLTIDAS